MVQKKRWILAACLGLWLTGRAGEVGAEPVDTPGIVAAESLSPTPEAYLAQLPAIEALLSSDDRARALPAVHALLDGAKRVFGPKAPVTLEVQHLLVVILSELGQLEQSIAEGEACLAAKREVLGDEHPDTIDMFDLQGANYGNARQNWRAAELIGKAYEMARRSPDYKGQVPLRIADDYAAVLARVGRVQESITAGRDVFARRVTEKGPHDFESLFSGANLVYALTLAGRLDEADRISLAMLRPASGAAGPDTHHVQFIRAQNNHAIVLGRMGRHDEEFRLLEQVLASARQTLGPDHYMTRIYEGNVLARQMNSDQPPPPAELLSRLDTSLQRQGPDHEQTLDAAHLYGLSLMARGNASDAEAAFRGALAGRIRAQGERHPRTLDSRYVLAANLAAQNRRGEALREMETIVAAVEDNRSAGDYLAFNDQRSWQSAYLNAYHARVSLLISLGRHDEAMLAMEGLKARQIRERARMAGALATADIPEDARGQLHRLYDRLSEMDAAPPAPATQEGILADMRRRELRRELVEAIRSLPFNPLRAEPAKEDVAKALARPLAPGELFIGYVLRDGQHLMAVTRSGTVTRSRQLGRIAGLADAVEALRQAAATPAGRRLSNDKGDRLHVMQWTDRQGSPRWRLTTGRTCTPEDDKREASITRDELRSALLAPGVKNRSHEVNWQAPECAPAAARELSPTHAVTVIARHLHGRLLAPILRNPINKSRLLISPDASLWSLPWELLRGRADDLVVHRHEVTTLHSLAGLPDPRTCRSTACTQTAPSLLAMGNPSYAAFTSTIAPVNRGPVRPLPAVRGFRGPTADETPTVNWPRLPHTQTEVDRVAALFAPAHRTVLTGPQAKASSLWSLSNSGELASYSHVLLSMHGYLDHSLPGGVGLVMAPEEAAPGQNGYLAADAVARLRFRSELAVVSACHSARGPVAAGEGLMGLAHAMQLAGARRSVLALWPVPDAQAMQFVVSFMTLVRQGMRPSAALAATKRSFQGSSDPKQRSPSVWGAFVLNGQG